MAAPYLTIYANPSGHSEYNQTSNEYEDRAYRDAIRRSKAAGVNYIYDIRHWKTELEPSQGIYDTHWFQRVAEEAYPLPIAINIAVIDGSNSWVPTFYSGDAWDSANRTTQFNNLIDALAAVVPATQPIFIIIGNETDGYFTANPTLVTPYGTFISNVKAHVKSKFTNAQVTVCFKSTATASWATYSAISAQCDLQCFTYYQINADFTVKAAHSISTDVSNLQTAIGAVPWMFQECGCPSSTVLGSSQSYQATFIDDALFVFTTYFNAGFFKAGMLSWSCDLSPAVVGLSFSPGTNVYEYLSSIGFRDASNSPKAAWNHILTGFANNPTDTPVIRPFPAPARVPSFPSVAAG